MGTMAWADWLDLLRLYPSYAQLDAWSRWCRNFPKLTWDAPGLEARLDHEIDAYLRHLQGNGRTYGMTVKSIVEAVTGPSHPDSYRRGRPI